MHIDAARKCVGALAVDWKWSLTSLDLDCHRLELTLHEEPSKRQCRAQSVYPSAHT